MRLLMMLALSLITSCAASGAISEDSMRGKIVCIDAGHGGTGAKDPYRVGVGGEREEWINLRVATMLEELLEARGVAVIMTRTEDVEVPLKERADMAVAGKADVFISVHHNATADRTANFPIVYYHGYAAQNQASVMLARILAEEINGELFGGKAMPSVCSDFTIFTKAGTAVLRHSYGFPGVIGEASFFSNPDEEARLKDQGYNRREAEAYVRALERYFDAGSSEVRPREGAEPLPAFEAVQEAERMGETAKRWREDYEEGRALAESDPERAFELLTRSVRSFPDSNVAGECHSLRAKILHRQGREEEARQEARRVVEFYAVAAE